MSRLAEIPLSILDLAPIAQGATAADSFRTSLDLARQAEALGYHRYWVAEHHNIAGVASSATSVLMAHLGAGTRRIRLGSGGIMLPNHSALMVAEQFGTLESLYPGRIDLGLGRAPGTDGLTARALRRGLNQDEEAFPQQVAELRAYFRPATPDRKVHAIPGEGLDIPVWILGSSGFGAQMAGQLGLPFGFAGQFSPDYILPALEIYRRSFRPGQVLSRPYAMVGLNVVVADNDPAARRLFTTLQQSFLGIIRGRRQPMPPPVDSMDGLWSRDEELAVMSRLAASIVGGADTVRADLDRFLELTGADELIVNCSLFDPADRMRSYALLADLAGLATGRSRPEPG